MEILAPKDPKLKIRDNRSGCPISTSLEIMGDNWSLILIRDLFLERSTFTEFMNSPEKISSNILSDRINKLQKYNIIEYRLHPKNRKIKQYYLTNSGINFFPLIYELSMWSKKYIDMEFNPIAIDWYAKNQGVDRKDSIDNTILEYKEFKKKLLSA
jgi:DNA-binding HxlR family transcriptional regulator